MPSSPIASSNAADCEFVAVNGAGTFPMTPDPTDVARLTPVLCR